MTDQTIKVNIDAEAIERQVVNAIVSSSIGVKLNEVVEKQCAALANDWGRALESCVNDAVKAEIRKQLVIDGNAKMIEEAVARRLKDETLNKVIDNVLSRISGSW